MGQIYIEAIQITSSSGIYKTNIYHNDYYLRLFVVKIHTLKSLIDVPPPPPKLINF